jgi:hypothetical protein
LPAAPTIPPALLLAVAEGGGRVSIVIGAGCSFEAPTAFPLARALSQEAHRKLVADGILAEAECPEPGNLAALATLVFRKTGSQEALVARFPLDRLRTARANAGYLSLVALMAEGAVSHVLSLNFDRAVENAASELGIEIHAVDAPGTPIPASATVVYLHGSAAALADSLVLREEVLTAAWRAAWAEVVAQRILAAPNVLFAGLGSAAYRPL